MYGLITSSNAHEKEKYLTLLWDKDSNCFYTNIGWQQKSFISYLKYILLLYCLTIKRNIYHKSITQIFDYATSNKSNSYKKYYNGELSRCLLLVLKHLLVMLSRRMHEY